MTRPGARPLAWQAAVVTALAAIVAGPALAEEQVRIRAGEHSGFSRIALDVPELGAWRISQEGRVLAISFDGREIAFDAAQIFPQRRVSRVSGARGVVEATGTRLELSMSCACFADAYEFASGMLVVDIRDEPGPTAAPPVTEKPAAAPSGKAAASSSEKLSASRSSRPTPWHASSAQAAAKPLDAAGPATDAPLPTALQAAAAVARPPTTSARTADPAPTTKVVAAARQRLLEQLTRAAEQGLVQFRQPLPADAADQPSDGANADEAPAPPSAPPEPTSEAPPASAAAPASPAREPPPTPVQAQLSAQTAYDRDRPGSKRRDVAATCPTESMLDTAGWSDSDVNFYDQVAARRRGLVEEFDRPDREAALSLARLYIRYGFGVEARRKLQEFAADGVEAALLAELSHAVDGEPAPPGGPLDDAADCPGRTALWRIAAGFAPSAAQLGDEEWRDSVLAAFAELPVMLRRLVGPALLGRLVDLGALDMAEAARLTLSRAAGDHGEAWRLASARLALARGQVEEGEAKLRDVIAAGGETAPEAMLALAASVLTRRDTLPAWLVEDISLEAFSHRGAALGERLLAAEIRGRAGRARLSEALDIVRTELAGGIERRRDVERALQRILESAEADAIGAARYAEAILTNEDLIGDGGAWDPARVAIASQLAAVGLPNSARRIVEPAAARDRPDALLELARAEIAEGRVDAALGALAAAAREPGAARTAALLRADALESAGRHDEAFEAARSHLPIADRKRAVLAWRAAAWADAARLPKDDPRRTLAAWMTDTSGTAIKSAEASPAQAPSLASARAALTRAASAQELIEEALRDG